MAKKRVLDDLNISEELFDVIKNNNKKSKKIGVTMKNQRKTNELKIAILNAHLYENMNLVLNMDIEAQKKIKHHIAIINATICVNKMARNTKLLKYVDVDENMISDWDKILHENKIDNCDVSTNFDDNLIEDTIKRDDENIIAEWDNESFPWMIH